MWQGARAAAVRARAPRPRHRALGGRPRGAGRALRDEPRPRGDRRCGKALGLPLSELERLARVTDGWDATRVGEELEGVPGRHTGPRWEAFRALTQEIAG